MTVPWWLAVLVLVCALGLGVVIGIVGIMLYVGKGLHW